MGVMMLAIENTRLQRRCTLSRCTSYVRNVNAVPRKTIPISSNVMGMCSAVAIAANAGGNAVKRTTITSMSQTWFASHTGLIASAINERCARARGPKANKSQTPPP
jgi:hypothetical protein